jgi:hypothetical protein
MFNRVNPFSFVVSPTTWDNLHLHWRRDHVRKAIFFLGQNDAAPAAAKHVLNMREWLGVNGLERRALKWDSIATVT